MKPTSPWREIERLERKWLTGEDTEPPRRVRKPSIASAIRQARKAGERGAVRVTLPDGTTVTSEREAAIEQMTAGADDWRGLQ
jgi:hypothetical protein